MAKRTSCGGCLLRVAALVFAWSAILWVLVWTPRPRDPDLPPPGHIAYIGMDWSGPWDWDRSPASLMVTDPTGSGPRELWDAGSEIDHAQPLWTPDGSSMFVLTQSSRDDAAVRSVPLAGGRPILVGWSIERYRDVPLAWRDPGVELAVVARRDRVNCLETVGLAPFREDARARGQPPPEAAVGPPERVAYSPDGGIAAVQTRGAVVLADTVTGEVRDRIEGARDPAWSPDGSELAYATGGTMWRSDPRRERTAVYTLATRATRVLHITRDRSQERLSDPTWAPDGTAIAFCAVRYGDGVIWIVRPDGSFPRRLRLPHSATCPSWGP